MRQPARIVFFGTPAYAVPALEVLATDERFDVRLVVTQPDRPAGRGRQLSSPPVKQRALELNLPVYQPASQRQPEARAPLESADADAFVVAAYGLIFGPKTLAIPRRGCVNLHASLLPAYRGASPVTAAILAGDDVTGVSLMVMETGLDTGPVISSAQVDILPTDTTGTLTDRLAAAGASLVMRDLLGWMSGSMPADPQRPGGSLVRPLVKADGWIDWRQPAARIERQVRAMQPWPRAWTTTPAGLQLQVLEVRISAETGAAPGSVAISNKTVLVGAGEGAVELVMAQPAGSGPMPGTALLQGRRISEGDVLGAAGAPDPPPPYIVAVES